MPNPMVGEVPGCDAPVPTVYFGPNGTLICRCMICARCDHHTGNNTQGHFWRWCKVTKQMEEFHMCCPDDCELYPNE